MFKKDPIFWAATVIFLAALLLTTVTQNQLWLALMIGSYLLRPTLASLGIGRRFVDERQMSLYYRSGNIAFAVMIIACIILVVKLNAENNHDWEMFALVIAIGLATKALLNVVLAKSFRQGATKIIVTVGLLITLFAALETPGEGLNPGMLMHFLPGLTILATGWVSKFYPRPVAILVFAVTAVLITLILSKGFTWGQIGTAILIAIPLITAGVCLLVPDEDETSAAEV